MTVPIAARPGSSDVFAEPLTADVQIICNDPLEPAIPSHGFHQPGEAWEVRFELNGAKRVLVCTLLWFSMHELVSIMGVGLGWGLRPHRPSPLKTSVLPIALLSTGAVAMADLLLRGVDEALVQALKQRAGTHGRSAEAEHRAILAAALLTPPRRKLSELLASTPDVGRDADFRRPVERAEAADVFGWHQCDQRGPLHRDN